MLLNAVKKSTKIIRSIQLTLLKLWKTRKCTAYMVLLTENIPTK